MDGEVEEEFYEHRGWAVFDGDGFLLDVDGSASLDEALDEVKRAFPDAHLVIDAYGTREVPWSTRLAANPRGTKDRRSRKPALAALEEARLPQVDLDRVLRAFPLDAAGTPLGDGLVDAHSELKGAFSTVAPKWLDPMLAAQDLIRGNFKLDKVPKGLTGGIVPEARGLSLAPNHLAYRIRHLGPGTFCSRSTPQCRAMCLVYSGRNPANPYNLDLKLATAEALYTHPAAFCRLLLASIHLFTCGARCDGRLPFVRLNVFSDIPWELFCRGLFKFFEDLQFYDYTKVPRRVVPPNYDLTFSYSGENEREARSELGSGARVAVVFGVRRGQPLPETFWGRPVLDGDLHDLRPLEPGGVIVGLRWKPPYQQRERYERIRGFSTFVQKPNPDRAELYVVAAQELEGHAVVAETPRYTDIGGDEDNGALPREHAP